MNWLDIDFVKCDKTENKSLVVTLNKSLVVTLEPHWSYAVSQEAYDVKLPHYSDVNDIIFSREDTNDSLTNVNSQQFYFTKHVIIKKLYLDLKTLFSANTVSFDLPSNENIIIHYQSDIILVSPIEHKEFRVNFVPWITTRTFQSFITIIWHLYHNNDSTLNTIIVKHYNSLSREVVEIAKLQAEILSNFSEEEMKAMDMETNPLYFPIAFEFIHNHFESFIQLINCTNDKETLNRMLTDERSASELSGEAKAVIIKRMAELEDERNFEL